MHEAVSFFLSKILTMTWKKQLVYLTIAVGTDDCRKIFLVRYQFFFF